MACGGACFFSRNFQQWRAPDANTILIRVGVNRFYRLGHVQVWNLDIQRTLPMGIVMNVGYNGSKGGDLDILRAPNRTADGAANPSAQPGA